MSSIPLERLGQAIAQISRQAGQVIMGIYEDPEQFEVEFKKDESPLTKADKAANDLIVRSLLQLSPRFPVIAEESSQVPYEERKNWEYFWLVDPLDGTREFVKRNGEFTVNIALIHWNRPVLGVVYAPVPDRLYLGHGDTAVVVIDGQPQPLQVPRFSMKDPALRVVCSRSHLNEATQAYIDQLNAPEKVAKGSSLKFMMIASGEADLYPRLGPTSEWDTAAAQAVLEAAGGKVLEWGKDHPLRYNKEDLLNPYFLAHGNIQA